ncbi:MAG TPA: cytidine deaminase [Pirellulaceae bacterium]|nr:cytidine deaminase [Pirellulaceae bacterium]HMO93515.1 cytidine deaminase [Pirellulaceae bacterium]HMP70420.1 cytidine deaminase [Pirellulaceae bacterium]
MQPAHLCELAIAARGRAYAPYSKFQVGAALLSNRGEVFVGCNVENAVYGLSICAERVAVAKAVTESVREFRAIAIAASPLAFPCGSCRQFLCEFSPSLEIILCGAERPDEFQVYSLADLLPHQFKLQH